MYYLKKGTLLDDQHRVQITVWDAKTSLVGHNVCSGGLSFTLEELVDSPMYGWFGLMAEADGRVCHQLLTTAEECDPSLIPAPCTCSAFLHVGLFLFLVFIYFLNSGLCTRRGSIMRCCDYADDSQQYRLSATHFMLTLMPSLMT